MRFPLIKAVRASVVRGGADYGAVRYSSGYSGLDAKASAVMKATPSILADKPAGTDIAIARWKLPAIYQKGIEMLHAFAAHLHGK